jgi:hypothetical protein
MPLSSPLSCWAEEEGGGAEGLGKTHECGPVGSAAAAGAAGGAGADVDEEGLVGGSAQPLGSVLEKCIVPDTGGVGSASRDRPNPDTAQGMLKRAGKGNGDKAD